MNAGCTGPVLNANVTSVKTCAGTATGTCLGTTAIICPLPGSAVVGNQLAPTAAPTVAAGSPTMVPTVAAITVLKATQVGYCITQIHTYHQFLLGTIDTLPSMHKTHQLFSIDVLICIRSAYQDLGCSTCLLSTWGTVGTAAYTTKYNLMATTFQAAIYTSLNLAALGGKPFFYTTVLDAILLPRLCSMVSTPMQVRHSIRHRAQLMATTMVQYSVQSLMPLRYQLSQPMVCHM